MQVQRIFQLAAFKNKREMTTGSGLSADNLVREFNEKVSASPGESVTVTYVTSAMAVYERILKDDTCRAIVLGVPLLKFVSRMCMSVCAV